MPLNESIVFPGSRCPHCAKPIAWHDNLPVLSWVFLRGRCRACAKPISIRYWLVELISGLIWAGLWYRLGWTAQLIAGITLMMILLAVLMTDIETGLIPDLLTLPGIVAGIVLSAAAPGLLGENVWWQGLIQSAIGLVAGGGLLWFTGWLGELIFRKESMGGGDIKLMAMLGTFLGVTKIVFVFFIAPVLALPVALFARYVLKSETIPFGPYLALAGALLFLFGDPIIAYFYS